MKTLVNLQATLIWLKMENDFHHSLRRKVTSLAIELQFIHQTLWNIVIAQWVH